MILSFSDFLSDNAVIIILILLGGILLAVSYIKRNVLSKYNDNSEDEDQTPEEILQDEMDNLVVTEKYNPNASKKKKDILDEEDDDFDYDHVEEKKEENDDFEMNVGSSYSFSNYDENNEDK